MATRTATKTSDLPDLITSEELANYLEINEGTLRNWHYQGKGPARIKPSGKRGPTRYRRSDVEDWLEQNREQG